MRRDSAAGVSKALTSFIEKVVKDLTTNATEELYEATPELTGFAETNWLATYDGALDTPTGDRATRNISKSAQDKSLEVIRNTYKFPAIVYIVNPVDYIGKLNAGSSRKAPAGFVQTSIAKAINSVI
jgi:uncharacterized protein CbrC (UPF0167 family)